MLPDALRYMTPPLIGKNVMNCCEIHIVGNSQYALAYPACCIKSANLLHLACRQLTSWVLLTMSYAPLWGAIGHIVSICTEKQMRLTPWRVLKVRTTGHSTLRMAARRVIAAVTDKFTGRNRTMRQFPSHARRTAGCSRIDVKLPIPAVYARSPRPTGIGTARFVYLFPEPFSQGAPSIMPMHKSARNWGELAAVTFAQLHVTHLVSPLGATASAVPAHSVRLPLVRYANPARASHTVANPFRSSALGCAVSSSAVGRLRWWLGYRSC
jgi:hypothetical protein